MLTGVLRRHFPFLQLSGWLPFSPTYRRGNSLREVTGLTRGHSPGGWPGAGLASALSLGLLAPCHPDTGHPPAPGGWGSSLTGGKGVAEGSGDPHAWTD